MLSTLPRTLKVLSIPLISLALTACGSGGGGGYHYHDRISEYNGNWQSACIYNRSTDSSSIKTLYITDTDYTIYLDEFDNSNCFGSSDFTTEVEGYLYFGDYKPFASTYCDNTIEVDFVPEAVYEDDFKIPSADISAYLNLPEDATYNIMCRRNNQLFTGDLRIDDGKTEFTRPLSLNYDNRLYAFD